jgi:hypothetical protein
VSQNHTGQITNYKVHLSQFSNLKLKLENKTEKKKRKCLAESTGSQPRAHMHARARATGTAAQRSNVSHARVPLILFLADVWVIQSSSTSA